MTLKAENIQDKQLKAAGLDTHSSIPHERALTGMKCLLDMDSMLPHFSQWLRPSLREIVSCRVSYVRYKPGTNCIIGYRLQCGALNGNATEVLCYAKVVSAQDYADACDKSSSKLWRNPDSTSGVHLIPEYCAILYRFPNDAILKGLRALDTAKKLQRILYSHLPEYPEDTWRISDSKLRLSVASYKPERRAVLRIGTKVTNRSTSEKRPLSLYIRFYADERGKDLIQSLKGLHNEHASSETIMLPEPICYLAEERALLVRDIPGVTLADKTGGEEFLQFVEMTANALALLHKSSTALFPQFSLEELTLKMKQTIVETASYLGAIAPEASNSISSLCDKLTVGLEMHMTRIGMIHGDFHPGQAICHQDRVGLIDFDRAQNGPQLADLANFIANVRLLALTNPDLPTATIEKRLIEAYELAIADTIDRQELSFWIACRMFFLAIGPFRQFKNNWRASLVELLEKCDKELR